MKESSAVVFKMKQDSQLVPKKMLTRSLSTNSMISLSSDTRICSDIPTSISNRDYALDKFKSLQKKKDSCYKDHMNSEMKQGQNFVMEFSTAAYELCKSCLNDIFSEQDFPYSTDRQDGIDTKGAVVDVCFRVYNTRADGTRGKMLKFVINCYNTTSQILVNGSKVEIFLSEIFERLCKTMKSRHKELEIININISETLDSLSISQPDTKIKQLKDPHL